MATRKSSSKGKSADVARRKDATIVFSKDELEDSAAEDCYLIAYAARSIGVLMQDAKSMASPLQVDNGVEIVVTVGALAEAIEAAGDRIHELLFPDLYKAPTEVANG